MKKHQLFLLFLLFTTTLFAQTTQKVLLIGIDGCRPDALQVANTPNIDDLLDHSIYSFDALNDDITSSGPGWSAMLTGVWSEKHGVTDNSFSGSNYETYPHFFRRIKEHDPNLVTASIAQWGPINDFIVPDTYTDFKLNVANGAAVSFEAVNYLSSENPDALFLHFDDVDHAGHSSGFSPDVPAYIEAIEDVDTGIGIVLNALTQRPNYDDENWLILLSTDHGGIGTSHGGNSIQEQTVFVIAHNKSFTPQKIKKDSSIVNIPIPNNCLDELTELSFDGNDDYVSVPNTGLFDFGSDQDFSVECRVRTNNAADVSIVGNKDWDSGVNKGFVFSFRFASGPEWKVNIGDGSNRADLNTGGSIADGEWHTLTATFDRDGLMKIYEDGVFVDETDISFVGDIDTDFDLRFGADGLGAYDYTGAIAEVRVWNQVLEETTISNWFCSSLDINHPNIGNLLGNWKMNEGLGANTVIDSGSFSNHGSIVGASWLTPDTVAVVYDYSETPRIPDLAVSALSHLCIPIDSAWQLDGHSIVPECLMTAISESLIVQPVVDIRPNPTKDMVNIKINSAVEQTNHLIQILTVQGQVIQQFLMPTAEHSIDLSASPNGIYLIKIETEKGTVMRRIVKF